MHSENKAPGAENAPDTTPATPGLPAADQAAGAADSGADLATELEQLRAALAAIREESLRERAELDNQRKRLAREIEQARRFANERLLSDLLQVLDSLDAGPAAVARQAGPVRDGLEATLRQLLKVGADHGLPVIDPAGQAFDPAWHQAISQVQASPEAAAGTVVQVFQKGYALNERLLRPAMVVVAGE